MKEEKIPMMSFGEAVATCWKKYFCFKGRARRSEYWWFSLFCLIPYALFCLTLIAEEKNTVPTFGILCILWSIVIFIPSLAVQVRRLHDGGYPGWIILLELIPYLGGLVGLFVFGVTLCDSDHKENKYGPSPKYRRVDEETEGIA